MVPIRVALLARRLTLPVLLMAATASPGLALDKDSQPAAPEVAIGSRVRYTESRGGLLGKLGARRGVTGRVTDVDDTSITVLPRKGPTVHISRTAPGSLQVSTGRRRRVLLGALAGGVAAGAFAAAVEYGGGGYCICMEAPEPDGRVVAQVALGGAVLGGVVALLRPEDRWARATMARIPASTPGSEAAWQVSPMLDLRTRGAGLSFHFVW